MKLPISTEYVEAKACVIRGTDRITAFIVVTDIKNFGKRDKIEQLFRQLSDIHRNIEEQLDIQYMENMASHGTAITDVTGTADRRALSTIFDSLYYELPDFSDVQNILLPPILDQSLSATLNKTIGNGSTNVYHYQLPKWNLLSGKDLTICSTPLCHMAWIFQTWKDLSF